MEADKAPRPCDPEKTLGRSFRFPILMSVDSKNHIHFRRNVAKNRKTWALMECGDGPGERCRHVICKGGGHVLNGRCIFERHFFFGVNTPFHMPANKRRVYNQARENMETPFNTRFIEFMKCALPYKWQPAEIHEFKRYEEGEETFPKTELVKAREIKNFERFIVKGVFPQTVSGYTHLFQEAVAFYLEYFDYASGYPELRYNSYSSNVKTPPPELESNFMDTNCSNSYNKNFSCSNGELPETTGFVQEGRNCSSTINLLQWSKTPSSCILYNTGLIAISYAQQIELRSVHSSATDFTFCVSGETSIASHEIFYFVFVFVLLAVKTCQR
ncbi:uncharacterized protein LOC101860427 [Aplysia californica]|uniref:Uncharacterized protein LOC101860427 n=1 Tax=Aplysia californica TaxID=6500 RepID=A0ABM0JWJ8_APLCA|nr:uncharacterized protein LOC101860427 [Aplysia californica]